MRVKGKSFYFCVRLAGGQVECDNGGGCRNARFAQGLFIAEGRRREELEQEAMEPKNNNSYNL